MVDPSSRVVTALLNKINILIFGYIGPAYRTFLNKSFWTSKVTTNLLKPFNIHISTHAILIFGYIGPAYRTETIKDSTDFISFTEQTKIGKDTILVSMDVSSLYTNIPQEEGTEIACKAYNSFHNYNPPIPTRFLREMLGLILNENLFQFNGENYLRTHGTAMGIKMAVSFANIFIAKI